MKQHNDVYLFMGGAYGDDFWTTKQAPDADQMRMWSCGELYIFKIDSRRRVYQPDGSGMWALIKRNK